MPRTANAEARATARALAAPGDGSPGLTAPQIREHLAASGIDVSVRTVERWCDGLLGGPGPRPAVDAAPFADAVAAGLSLREAEKQTGVSRRTAARKAAAQ
jgi:hypothetical protein